MYWWVGGGLCDYRVSSLALAKSLTISDEAGYPVHIAGFNIPTNIPVSVTLRWQRRRVSQARVVTRRPSRHPGKTGRWVGRTRVGPAGILSVSRVSCVTCVRDWVRDETVRLETWNQTSGLDMGMWDVL